MRSSVIRVIIFQRFLMHYRIPLFKRINQLERISLTVVVNDPQVLNWNKNDLGFDLVYLPAFSLKLGYKAKNYHIPLSIALIKYLWQSQYDVIISEGATNVANNLMIFPLARLRGNKFIWWGAGRRRFAKKNAFRKLADPLINYFIRHADANIAYGSIARDYMISVGADPEKVFIAQNTIDSVPIFDSIPDLEPQVNKLRQQLELDDKHIILYVGVIEQRKKVENLILAYQEAARLTEHPMSLVIVGDGPHFEALKQWYEKNIQILGVHFVGKVIEGVGAYFSMCDVFVLPSEGGLALNQAMAYGKPVIATSADGTEVDLIQQGANGYLVGEDEIPTLAEAIVQITQNSGKQRGMGKLSEQLMREKFTLDNMVKGFLLSINGE